MVTRGARTSSLRGQLLRLSLLVAAGVFATTVVANTLSVPVAGSTESYAARFTNVEGLAPGNDVTLAGVRVGRVESVHFTPAASGGGGAEALVEFEIEEHRVLDAKVEAAIRYGDMLGLRYLALSAPETSTGATLHAGATIPTDRTTPPVDLTALLNGFKPLFDAIDPANVNELARTVVGAFQGQGDTIESLLVQIAQVAGNLQDHEVVFTQLVANLETVLGSVDERGAQVERLIAGLTDLSATAAERNDQLIALLDDGSSAVSAAVAMMQRSVAPMNRSIDQLNATTESWMPNTATFNTAMTELNRFAGAINNIGDYGGWLNLYLCNFTFMAGEAEVDIFGSAHSQVCR